MTSRSSATVRRTEWSPSRSRQQTSIGVSAGAVAIAQQLVVGGVGGRAGENGVLQIAQPRSGREAERGDALFAHVHVRLLLDRVRQARDVVVDEAAADAKRRLLVQHVAGDVEILGARRVGESKCEIPL